MFSFKIQYVFKDQKQVGDKNAMVQELAMN
jgi:hypothetical protein